MGSGFTTFTAGNVLTASDVNNYLMEQSVMVFATTAARDSAITAPEAGMTAYINTGDSSEGLYSYTGTTWNKGPGWNAPWGFVAQVTSTVSSQTTTGTLDLAGGSLSFTAFANRYYKVSFFGSLFGDATVNQMDVYDNTAAASIVTFENPYSSATFNGTVHASTIVSTWTAGTRSLKLRLIRFNVGTAKSSGGVRLMVEDIGPSGAPN